jgi:hypothetical protein
MLWGLLEPKMKKAGEYSEEDTHRPAATTARLQRAELSGGFSRAVGQPSLRKETR